MLGAGAVAALTGCGAGYGDPVTGGGATTTNRAAAPTDPAHTPAGGVAAGQPAPAAPSGNAPAAPSGDPTASTPRSAPRQPATSVTQGAAYSGAVQNYCAGFTGAGQRFGESYLAAGTDLNRVGSAITAFGSDMRTLAQGLRRSNPPGQYRTFHATTLASLDRLTTTITANASRLRAGNTDAGLAVFQDIKATQQALTSFPAALLKAAPACRAVAK